jgi:toxin-antitoxin system PIN domain toxin
MKPALLDVNVLIAVLDPRHALHRAAASWFRRTAGPGWASCAVTQNGFVRIVSQPSYANRVTPAQAVEVLRRATGDADHRFLPCDVQLCDAGTVRADRLLGPKQVTDVYLLALAAAHGCRFATFDERISPAAAVGATPGDLAVVSLVG